MNSKIDELIALLDRGMESREELAEGFPEIISYLCSASEDAEKVILSRMSEKRFVQLARVISGISVTVMMTKGDGMGLLYELAEGELEGFVHSVTLVIIGVLMKEDVI